MNHDMSTTVHISPLGQLYLDQTEALSRVVSLRCTRCTYESAINDKLDRVDNIAEKTIKPGISAFCGALEKMLSLPGRESLTGDDDQLMRDILKDHSDLLAFRDGDASLKTIRWDERCFYDDWRNAGESTVRAVRRQPFRPLSLLSTENLQQDHP